MVNKDYHVVKSGNIAETVQGRHMS